MTALDAAELGLALFEEIGDAAFVVEPNTDRLLNVNPMAERTMGRPREELLQLSLDDVFRAESDEGLIRLKRALHNTQTFYSQEGYFCQGKSAGQWLPVNLTVTRLHTQQGPLGLVLARDITERKKAEQDLADAKATLEQRVVERTAELAQVNQLLREQMEKLTSANESLMLFRTLIDHTNDAVEVIDPETGRILDVNERACLDHGYTREEYLSLSVPDVDPLAIGVPWENLRQRTRRSGSLVFESQHRRKDGSVFPVEVNLTYIRLDRDYHLAVVRDITERQQAEQRFAALLDAAPDAIVVIDSAGRIKLSNEQTEEMFGYGRDELLGQPVEMLIPERFRAVHPEHRTRYVENPKPRSMGAGLELFGRRKDGNEFPIDICLSPLWTEEKLQVIAAVRDVTELKRLEAQFRQSQKMEAVGRLAGGVAHDFNNILTIINNYAELILDGLHADDTNRDSLVEIKRASDRAASLTRQLLAFSRKQVLQPRVVDLNTLLGRLLKMLDRLIGEDVELALEPHAELGLVRVDPGHFEQAIINLVVNARDAMPQGGRLVIETRNAELESGYLGPDSEIPKGQYVLVSVSDSGEGFDEGTSARVFEPFFTTKGPGKGTGLGLAMVYGFVRQSGGHVEVTSRSDHGTTFRIYLPRIEAPLSSTEPSPEAPAGPARNETVLLVEDERAVRALAGRLLRSSGYTVLEAADGEEAIRVAQRHAGPIHILVTDLVMPHLGGHQLAKRLTQERPDARVLFMSGYAEEQALLDEVIEARAAFLQKPFTQVDLTRKVREVLDG